MKRIGLLLGILLVLSGLALGQKTAQRAVKTDSSATVDQAVNAGSGVTAGTQVSGQLQNSLDVKSAKVGDQVRLKTTKSVKQNGQTVIAKGATLVGHVTSVQRQVKGNAHSSLGVVFNDLQQGGRRIPINAMITSVSSAQTASSVASDDLQNDTFGSSTTQASTRSSRGGGGLLGGVTNTVGSVANTTTQTVGGVVDTTGRTVGSTTRTLGSSVKGLTVSGSTSASAQGGSTLNMSGGDLHLDKGTMFNLSVSSSASLHKD